MAYKILHVALCSSLLLEVLGAPFLLGDPANQFLHLKRHVYSQDHWDSDHSPSGWRFTLADQAQEIWTSLKTIAHYCLDMNTFTFDISSTQ
ncbi:uncharacterized protein C3orf85 homolog [Perognathus longimembris pacificus]|uniref:uncharacterized protein C3orf85 homolog n=1 Tax=Perognathus longimembris pacificus TaxID=214514 RepID=UPI0020188647|nr:uncharacterized protein C3orf85 homolog [Perognathus longimembris pacificus]